MDYIAIALAPGIAISLYIFYKDVYNREPKLIRQQRNISKQMFSDKNTNISV